MNIRSFLLPRLPAAVGARAALLLVASLLAVSGTAQAQTIFISNSNGTNGVRSYNINGTLINSSLISGDGLPRKNFNA